MKSLQWANRKGRSLCRNRRVMQRRGSMVLIMLHPAPCCCRRMAAFPGSGEAEDLATEVVVDEMDGRRPGWAC